MPINKETLVCDLQKLGVRRGDILNVKASLRSVGKIEGGVEALIGAILEVIGPEGTMVTDSFINVYGPFNSKFREEVADQTTPSYAGALANAMIKHPGSVRSMHPVQKFVLIGRDAKLLSEGHDANAYAYEVLRRMAERDGRNLKIGPDETVPGVGTTHVAIGLTKFRQRRPKVGVRYKDERGETRTFYRNWSGGCMQAFYNLNAFYERIPGAVIARGKIGEAPCKFTSMKVTLAAELDFLKQRPAEFLRCGNPECIQCKFSWEGFEDSFAEYAFRKIRAGDFAAVREAFRVRFIDPFPF